MANGFGSARRRPPARIPGRFACMFYETGSDRFAQRRGSIVGEESVASIWERVFRAARLDAELYEEVEADREATGQATAVVALSALAAGIGNLGTSGVLGLLVGAIAFLLAWYAWAFITYVVGTRLLPEPATRADYGELLRTTGFAAAPNLIRVLAIVPVFGKIVFGVAVVWMLIAMVIAVRQALDYSSTWRAIAVCVIGWVVFLVISVVLRGGV